MKVIYSRELNCRQIVWSIQCGFEIGTRWKTPSRHPLVDKDIILIALEEKYTKLQQVVGWSLGLSVWSLPGRASLAFNQPSSERERTAFYTTLPLLCIPLLMNQSQIGDDWTSQASQWLIGLHSINLTTSMPRKSVWCCKVIGWLDIHVIVLLLTIEAIHEYEKWLNWSCRFESFLLS